MPGGRWFAESYLVLLQPLIGVFLSGHDLAAGHARCENCDAILAGLVASSLSENGPEVSLGQILRDASAGPVICAERCLCHHMTALGCHRKPTNGFRVVLLDFFPGCIVSTQRELGRGIALLSEAAEAFQAGRIRLILGGSFCR